MTTFVLALFLSCTPIPAPLAQSVTTKPASPPARTAVTPAPRAQAGDAAAIDGLFKAAVTPADPATYDAFVGEYELVPGFVLTMTREGGKLMSQATGQGKVEIFPSAPTESFLKVVDAQISFVRDAAGAVTGLVLHQGGRDMPARKIK